MSGSLSWRAAPLGAVQASSRRNGCAGKPAADFAAIPWCVPIADEPDREERNVLVRPAKPYQSITVTRGIDLETGRPIEVEEKEPRENEVMREICPAAPSAKDWQPSAFSPRTGLVYVPHQHLCMASSQAAPNAPKKGT